MPSAQYRNLLDEQLIEDMVTFHTAEAVQVVESRAEDVRVRNEWVKKKVLRTIAKYKSGPSLEEILLRPDVKDLPVLVFSIAGKTRGGKSFLLNMLIKYLESQGENDWIAGTVPHGFPWNAGLDSVTKGLWIWPKIYKLKNSNNTEVGILLLDNEGMFDGEVTDGEIIAISGISTAISYIQMFNTKEKLTTDYLENVVSKLIKGIEEMDADQSSELRQDYRLMFVVRDWIGADSFGYGLQGGQSYIQRDSQKESGDTKALWEMVCRTFRETECCLLPHPGSAVFTTQFTQTGNLNELSPQFLWELKKLVESLFSPENLIPPETILTGQGIHNLLITVDGKVADDSLSFLNMYTDHANYSKVEKLKLCFELKLAEVHHSELMEMKTLMSRMLSEAEATLKGKTAAQHLVLLRKALEERMNKRVVENVLKQYDALFLFASTTADHHSAIWPEILNKLDRFLSGDEAMKEDAYIKTAQKAARIYYKELSKEIAAAFRVECDKRNLDSLAGFDERTVRDKFVECADFAQAAGSDHVIHPVWFNQQQLLREILVKLFLQRVHTLTGLSKHVLNTFRRKQYEYFESFTLLSRDEGNWDTIPKKDETLLHKKIGYAMFGLPKTHRENSDSDFSDSQESSELGYSDNEEGLIKPVANQIITLSKLDPIKFSCIFLTFLQGEEIVSTPLFRIQTLDPNDHSTINYVDTTCRVYTVWEDFLASNNLPDIVFCYPLNGIYDKANGFSVAFAKSPASAFAAKMLKASDTTGKWVSGSSGLAGAAALAAPVLGVALAPAVGTFAIVGGGVAGVYGMMRVASKVLDKFKHKEPVTGGDVFSFTTNMFATAGMGAGAAAEGLAVLASQVAQGISSLNALTVLSSGNEAPNMVLLLNEIADNALKILFYFNTSSSPEAIEIIRKALKLNDNTTSERVLETLLECNSIQSTIEIKGNIELKKHISEGVATLVMSLLKTVSMEIKDTVLLTKEIDDICQSFRKQQIDSRERARRVILRMSKLYTTLKSENENLVKRVMEVICENTNCESEVRKNFLSEIMSKKNGHQLVLIVRYFICLLISRVRKANKFYNNIDHETLELPSYNVGFHPLKEVTRQIRDLVEQEKSAMDLRPSASSELDRFIRPVLNLVFERAKPTWKSQTFGKYMLKIAEEIVEQFDNSLDRHVTLVRNKKNPTCSDLDNLFQEFGMQGNYGSWMLQNVLDNFETDKNWNDEPGPSKLTVLPAWSGVVDNLFCYSSDQPIERKQLLVQAITDPQLHNYLVMPQEGNLNLFGLEPSDSSLPTYYTYSLLDSNGIESGFVWFDK